MYIATLVTCVYSAKESVLEFPQWYSRKRFPPFGETSPISRELLNMPAHRFRRWRLQSGSGGSLDSEPGWAHAVCSLGRDRERLYLPGRWEGVTPVARGQHGNQTLLLWRRRSLPAGQ